MKNKLPCLLFALLLSTSSQAQNKYTFSKTTGNAYADITGDINVTFSMNPSTGLYTIPGLSGETFDFFGLPFTFGGLKTIAVGEGPFLRVDNDSSLVIVDAAFTYVDTIDATSRISYLLQGPLGSRILKTQYKNLSLSYGQTGNFINVQIWYFQQSGIIEIHYGPRSANNASGYNITQGPNIGIFYSPDNFSGCYEKLWCNGPPTAMTLDSAANYVFKAMSGVPDDGTIYRFTPRVTQTMTTVGLEEITQTAFTIVPNPATDKISISGNQSGKTLSLYDFTGRLVKEWKSLSETQQLDVSQLKTGYYFIQISGTTGIHRKNLIISR